MLETEKDSTNKTVRPHKLSFLAAITVECIDVENICAQVCCFERGRSRFEIRVELFSV